MCTRRNYFRVQCCVGCFPGRPMQPAVCFFLCSSVFAVMQVQPTAHLVRHLRQLMAERGLTAYYIPSSDPHMGEYVPERYLQRRYMTGFRGSCGWAVVTKSEALFWTEERYHLQATKQLEAPPWTLMKWGQAGVPAAETWLADNVERDAVVGFDPWTISVQQYRLSPNLDWTRHCCWVLFMHLFP